MTRGCGNWRAVANYGHLRVRIVCTLSVKSTTLEFTLMHNSQGCKTTPTCVVPSTALQASHPTHQHADPQFSHWQITSINWIEQTPQLNLRLIYKDKLPHST